MKKIAIAGLSALVLGQGHAKTLEERVEALEYQGYESFLKVSGSMEMRFDYVNRDNKERYNTITDASAYGTGLGTVAVVAPTQVGDWLAADCGETVGGVEKEGCSTVGADQKDNSKYARMFFNLDIESNPSNRLSFFGRLSMAKYLSTITTEGENPNSGAFSDLSAGATAADASLWVERAFANYAVSKDLTFTFGRLPTIDGAPEHFHKDQPMAGSYPILAFSGIFDGMALTQSFGEHKLRLVYSPFSSVNYDNNIAPITNSNGDKISRIEDTYALMYEYSKANVGFAKKLNVIAMHNMIGKMPIIGQTDLTLNLQRTSFYAEALGIADTSLDLALHGMSSTTKSEGSLIGLSGTGGWLTDEEEATATGGAYGVLARYNFRNGFMQGSSLGVEYFHGGKDAFLYDAANLDPVSMYTTYGDAYRVFYTKNFEGGLKWNIQYMNQQQDYTRPYVGLVGETQEIDRKTSFVSTSFLVNF